MAEKQSKEMQAKESKAAQSEETKELLVKVTRESFGEKDGEKLYSYHTKAIIRGKEKLISLVPKDNGGYELLALIFGDLDTIDGKIVIGKFQPEKGEAVETIVVEISLEEDGIIYDFQLKPQRDSDKASLKIFAQILKAKQSN